MYKDQMLGEGWVEAEDGKLDCWVLMSVIRWGRISEMCRKRRVLSGIFPGGLGSYGASAWGSVEMEPGGSTPSGA